MYERILVAVDGSNTSSLALNEAISLAKIHHASLRLVHVIDPIMTYTVIEGDAAHGALGFREFSKSSGGDRGKGNCQLFRDSA